jgi:ABC-type Fe3+ transport system substrate-binding protein
LNIMTPITEIEASEIITEAEKDLGITINLVRLSDGKGIARIRSEAEVGKITIDYLFRYDFESFLILKMRAK